MDVFCGGAGTVSYLRWIKSVKTDARNANQLFEFFQGVVQSGSAMIEGFLCGSIGGSHLQRFAVTLPMVMRMIRRMRVIVLCDDYLRKTLDALEYLICMLAPTIVALRICFEMNDFIRFHTEKWLSFSHNRSRSFHQDFFHSP